MRTGFLALGKSASVWIFLALAPILGCAQHDIEVHPEAFNRAMGSLDTRLLLLNAVRASKNYPMEFTKVSTILGGAKVSSELDPSLPFPFASSRSYDPGLKISHERNFSSLNIANLNTEEAQKALKKQLSYGDMRYYVGSGWPGQVFSTLAFEDIRVHAVAQSAIDRLTAAACKAATHPYCSYLSYWISACGERPEPSLIKGETFFRYINNGLFKCQYAQFQIVQIKFAIVNLSLSARTIIVKQKIVKDGKPAGEEREIVQPSVSADDPWLNELLARNDKRLASKELFTISSRLRSPERIVRFLGELIAVQNYGDASFVPRIFIDGELVDFFVVTRGTLDAGKAAISVQDEEGDWFFVPTPQHGSLSRHRTLQVMALTIDILNSAVSKGDIPQVQTLTLSTP